MRKYQAGPRCAQAAIVRDGGVPAAAGSAAASATNKPGFDSDGEPLSGGSSYSLNLPTPIPAANFWSLTLYEADNASGLANGQPFKKAAGATG